MAQRFPSKRVSMAPERWPPKVAMQDGSSAERRRRRVAKTHSPQERSLWVRRHAYPWIVDHALDASRGNRGAIRVQRIDEKVTIGSGIRQNHRWYLKNSACLADGPGVTILLSSFGRRGGLPNQRKRRVIGNLPSGEDIIWYRDFHEIPVHRESVSHGGAEMDHCFQHGQGDSAGTVDDARSLAIPSGALESGTFATYVVCLVQPLDPNAPDDHWQGERRRR